MIVRDPYIDHTHTLCRNTSLRITRGGGAIRPQARVTQANQWGMSYERHKFYDGFRVVRTVKETP